MAKNQIEVTEAELLNVALNENQSFPIEWAERIFKEQTTYDGFKPFALPENSPFELVDGRLKKK